MLAPVAPLRSSQAVEFLRVVQQHHIQLSSMADFKANVLLGASFLVLTGALREVHDGKVTLALVMLMLTCFVAATLVLLAMLPVTKSGPAFSPNLLFFGVFAAMPEEDYQVKMQALLNDEALLYQAMIRDIHQLGRVLGTKKYKRLGQAYQVFFCGLMASAVAFVAQLVWQAFAS